MNGDYLFAVGTIGLSKYNGRKPQTLLLAARHNRREIQAELGARGRIDPSRTHLNEALAGPTTAAEVVAQAKTLMAGAGVDAAKLRKDYTQAIEVLFSLPASAAIDDGQYFQRCVEWAGRHFGVVNILSADIHRDESAPHCHVLVLPLVNNKMKGSALKGRKETAAMCESFYRSVAQSFGLKQPAKRLVGAARYAAANAVNQALEGTQDAILQSGLWETVKQAIERDPAPYMAALGIEATPHKTKPLKKFVDYVVSTGKGAKTERRSKPIAFCGVNQKPIAFQKDQAKDQKLSCVAFGETTAALHCQTDTPVKPEQSCIDVVRIKDIEQDPNSYDYDTGEHFQLPPKAAQRHRLAAEKWVSATISNRKLA